MSGTKETLTVGVNERVTLIEAWRNIDLMWYRLRLTLNTGATKEYNPPHDDSSTDILYTYTIPAVEEFTGFFIEGASSECQVRSLIVYSRAAVCSISIDLSAING